MLKNIYIFVVLLLNLFFSHAHTHTHKTTTDKWWFLLQVFFKAVLSIFPPRRVATSRDLLDWQSSWWCSFWIAKLKGIFFMIIIRYCTSNIRSSELIYANQSKPRHELQVSAKENLYWRLVPRSGFILAGIKTFLCMSSERRHQED